MTPTSPSLPPVVAYETTPSGWRGLTADGEILDVRGSNGAAAKLPVEGITVVDGNGALGHRAVPKELSHGLIGGYLAYFNRARMHLRAGDLTEALSAIHEAMALAPTARAHFVRGVILLGLGRWAEGFDDWFSCEQSPAFERRMTRAALDAGIRRWLGEDLNGKRLLLAHDPQDHGFGDTIMMLRYVPQLRAMGADVVLVVPPELTRLASQLAPTSPTLVDAHYYCPLLALLRVLRVTPEQIPLAPYLALDQGLVAKWRARIGNGGKPRIGVAWTAANFNDNDYPRMAPLSMFVQQLRDAKLVSVQQQGGAEADLFGVQNFRFDDFADCAALMSVLDEIVTIDTAAVHLAGAVGHPRVTLMLSHWHSWRWLSPLYATVRQCRQRTPGDWESAFAARHR